jgi:FHS family glucose/mannose:H+ symporter-like MFS transporter
LKTRRRKILFGGAATGIFVFGIVMAVLGTLFGLPAMRERLKIDLAQQGNVFLFLYVGILLATLVAGPVIDSIGNKVILVTSAALVASGMAGFAYAHSFGSAAMPAVLLGLGGGGLNTSTNALVSNLYGEDRGPMLNVLGIFYGIGALGIPLLAGGNRRAFPDCTTTADLRGVGRSLRAAVFGGAIPGGERGTEFLVARNGRGCAVSRRADVGLVVVL